MRLYFFTWPPGYGWSLLLIVSTVSVFISSFHISHVVSQNFSHSWFWRDPNLHLQKFWVLSHTAFIGCYSFQFTFTVGDASIKTHLEISLDLRLSSLPPLCSSNLSPPGNWTSYVNQESSSFFKLVFQCVSCLKWPGRCHLLWWGSESLSCSMQDSGILVGGCIVFTF